MTTTEAMIESQSFVPAVRHSFDRYEHLRLEYRGWSFSRISQQNVLPKSIRDNPGAYRSTYGGFSRYIGGK